MRKTLWPVISDEKVNLQYSSRGKNLFPGLTLSCHSCSSCHSCHNCSSCPPGWRSTFTIPGNKCHFYHNFFLLKGNKHEIFRLFSPLPQVAVHNREHFFKVHKITQKPMPPSSRVGIVIDQWITLFHDIGRLALNFIKGALLNSHKSLQHKFEQQYDIVWIISYS